MAGIFEVSSVTAMVLSIVIAYFLGNISPSTLLARAAGKDIKKEGSGNAGTTNALRVLGKKAAVITLVIDIGKGFLAVKVGFLLAGPMAAMYCALAAFIGHIWPVLFRFKGGKGVAVAFGAILGVNWQLALLALAIVAVTVLLTRMVSMGSVIAAISFPVLAWRMEREFFWIGCVMALIMLYAHRSNIGRIFRGEENKLSFKKK
ncbi:glycerol-3-phosphate 1-O-acyltransferase PlsY [Ihubacter sp. rT4E-8]|uniref:glycerol-3-phosphate 1-O-acyltransferase PlsY n=1 Tax=Ihubacter sp. rT4E-8 TaxID=3242369 RepID=UPI003CF69D59